MVSSELVGEGEVGGSAEANRIGDELRGLSDMGVSSMLSGLEASKTCGLYEPNLALTTASILELESALEARIEEDPAVLALVVRGIWVSGGSLMEYFSNPSGALRSAVSGLVAAAAGSAGEGGVYQLAEGLSWAF